jgi:phosphomevalonate kinase
LLPTGLLSRNAYIQSTVWITLSVLSTLLSRSSLSLPIEDLEIIIQADNDFYSFGRDRNTLPKFANVGCTIEKANKTGLGSSAALITALVGVLYGYVGRADERELIHNTAQLCHCYVQGKVTGKFNK